MPKKRAKSKRAAKPAPPPVPAVAPALQPALGDRLTYRELRNTPGRVWERLSNNEPLTLVADGQVKAVVIPVPDGNADRAIEAYQRGRALQAMREIQAESRRSGRYRMTLAEINAEIKAARQERLAREAAND